MRTAHGAAFHSSFVAQIRDSGFGFLRRLLSTTNPKSAEFCFSLNWPTNRPVLRYGTTPRRFCGQGFFGLWPLRKAVLWPGTKTGRYVVRFFFGFVAFQKKTGRVVVRIFGLGYFVARNISRRTVLWPDFFCELVTFVSGSLRPVHVWSKLWPGFRLGGLFSPRIYDGRR